MIARYITHLLQNALHQGKTIIIYGPRQSGKTTLVKSLLEQHTGEKQYLSSDYLSQIQRLSTRDHVVYTNMIGSTTLLVIDEAQRIPDIGLCLKTIHDHFPQCQVIATGSSSFELAQSIQEPLTGRKNVFSLYPLGIHELFAQSQWRIFYEQLELILIYGLYPDVYLSQSPKAKEQTLQELVDAYLFKDILTFEGIKKSDTIVKLARLLAFQIGKPVSINELAEKLGINARTVDRYVTILEQAFIIFRIGSYSKNLRKEVTKGQKYYFWDLGIRNGLIGQYQPLDMRNDKGELRENLVIAEILKKKSHTQQGGTYYFWRTYDDQELDLIYEYNGQISAYEIKWADRGRYHPPSIFTQHYGPVQVITHENVLQRIGT